MACFKFGEIILPVDCDTRNWAVVACDQYTSDRGYWDCLEASLREPTTLKLIFPECYLSDDNSARIASVVKKQNEYISANFFREIEGTVLVKRKTAAGNERWGLMCLIDLDAYSPDADAFSPIRATEGLVESRIPPRVAIRKNCPLELPHIMLLIDDGDKTVIEPLKGKGEIIYDGDLNSNGGHITGYNIKDTGAAESALNDLYENSTSKYGCPLLFLVGDGNHSLATAKACRDENNPLSRYALAEVVNVYDEGLKFQPIHRAVFDVKNDDFLQGLCEITSSYSGKTTIYDGFHEKEIPFPEDVVSGIELVQKFTDEYISRFKGRVDYIHGEKELKTICANTGAVGITFGAIDKNSFFPYVVKHGSLPRKTFSLGEADEKRYYMEARIVRK